MSDHSSPLGPAISGKAVYKTMRDKNAYAALGRAVSYLMTKPSFASLNFGHWAKTLTGQINRKHYFFVLKEERVVGFLGWAFVDEARAKEWVQGRADIRGDESIDGDCIVINAWAADTEEINRFILRQIRIIMKDCKAAYAKRFYKNGKVRPLRVTINDFVATHIEADASNPA